MSKRRSEGCLRKKKRSADRRGSEVLKKGKKDKNDRTDKTMLDLQTWYHGMMLRGDVEGLLRRDGDFLVRATEDGGAYDIVISVRGQKRVHHFKIIQAEGGKWKLDAESFDTVYHLIKNYWKTGRNVVEGKELHLKNPVKRPRWMVSWANIEEQTRLGEGAHGEVCLGELRDPEDIHPPLKVAVKKCKDLKYGTEADRIAFLTEAKIMLELKHENVLRLLGIAADRPPVRLIMEFCPGGSLEIYLRRKKDSINSRRRGSLCLQAARGMRYLAEKQIVHRDLAARNCLLGQKGEVKIADFGMSVKGKQHAKGPLKVAVRWTAPEAMVYSQWTTKSDVYSYGVLMWEIYNKAELPWGDQMDNMGVKGAVLDGRILHKPTDCPEDIYQMMKRCWALDKESRPSFESIALELGTFASSDKTNWRSEPDETQRKVRSPSGKIATTTNPPS